MTSKKMYVIMTPNVERILASLYFVIAVAFAKNRKVTQYDLVKTLFLADRSHLNKWGRPITFDNYKAMKHGPVPSLAYDLLKGEPKALASANIEKLPWRFEDAGGGKKNFFPAYDSNPFIDALSESDIDELESAFSTVRRLGFAKIRSLTHEDRAYVDAWREDGGRKAYDMKFGLLFNEPNFERAEVIAEHSPYV